MALSGLLVFIVLFSSANIQKLSIIDNILLRNLALILCIMRIYTEMAVKKSVENFVV